MKFYFSFSNLLPTIAILKLRLTMISDNNKLNVSRSTFYQGDCLVEMDKIADKSVDMILCDLPYGTTACKWDVIIPFEPLWKHYERVIKDNGAIVLTATQPFSTLLVNSNLNKFHCEWIWHKSKPNGVAFKNQPMRNHEHILVFGKIKTFNAIMEEREGFTENSIKRFADAKRLGVQTLGTYGNSKNGTTGMVSKEKVGFTEKRKPTTVKKFGSVVVRHGSLHPTAKPIELMEYLIKTYTNEGETVLDNCMGSGTTGVACKNLNRNFIGIEKDEKYFDISVKRINEYS